MKEVIRNITIQESRLDRATELIEKLENTINDWNNFLPEFQELMNYYNSPNWFIDVEYRNTNAISKDVKCGVLSEDAIYNIFLEQRELNIKMIRVALSYIEDKTHNK